MFSFLDVETSAAEFLNALITMYVWIKNVDSPVQTKNTI